MGGRLQPPALIIGLRRWQRSLPNPPQQAITLSSLRAPRSACCSSRATGHINDLLPVFWTTDDWKIPVMMGGPERESGDESIEVLGVADRVCDDCCLQISLSLGLTICLSLSGASA